MRGFGISPIGVDMRRAASRKKEQGLLPQIPWELRFSVFDYPLADLLKSLSDTR